MENELKIRTKSLISREIANLVRIESNTGVVDVAIDSVRRIFRLDAETFTKERVFAEVVLPIFTMRELCLIGEMVDLGRTSYKAYKLERDNLYGEREAVWSIVEGGLTSLFGEMFDDADGVRRLDLIGEKFRRLSLDR